MRRSSIRPRTRRAVFRLSILLAFTHFAGCSTPTPKVEAWVPENTPEYVADTAGGGAAPMYLRSSVEPARIRLRGAAGETLSSTVALRITGESAAPIRCEVAQLVTTGATIDPSNVEVFRMHAVHVSRWPGWHIRSIPRAERIPSPLDVLVPIDAPLGGLQDAGTGDPILLWLDVTIPRDAPAATFHGALQFKSNGRVVTSVLVELVVWPFQLPGNTDVAVLAELNHRKLVRHLVDSDDDIAGRSTDDWRGAPHRAAYDDVLRQAVTLMTRHGVTPVFPRWNPPMRSTVGGEPALDWELVDPVLRTLSATHRSRGARVPAWVLSSEGIVSGDGGQAVSLSSGAQSLIRTYFAEAAAHLLSIEPTMTVALELPDVAGNGLISPDLAGTMAELAHSADRRIRTMLRHYPQDMTPWGWPEHDASDLPPGVDIWAPRAQFFDPAVMASERAAGRRVWLTLDRPPFSGTVDFRAPATHVRVITWQAARLEADTVLLDSVNDWPESTRPAQPQACVDFSPATLLYPGTAFGLRQALPSVRLKRLRQSVQDAAYVRLLKDRNLTHIVDAIGESICAYAGARAYKTHYCDGRAPGWVADERAFELAREIMGESLVHAAQTGSGAADRSRDQHDANWRRLMSATRRIRVDVEGARVRRVNSGPGPGWEARISASLFNGRRVPIEGSLQSLPPAGWSHTDAAAHPLTVAPNEWRRVFVTLWSDVPPISPGGSVPLPLELSLPDETGVPCEARVSLVTATPASAEIRIDGDLSEWPPGWGNVLSDFRSVAPAGNHNGPTTAIRPVRDTLVVVMRDERNLYVAVNALIGTPSLPRETSRNAVTYEDLVPVGEELVELLFDPLNAGTRTPSDVFRLAVKPTGTYLAEQGVTVEPPCGSRRPWPCDVEVAVKTDGERWITEVRMPLRSFESFSTGDVVWGFNVTRFDADAQEFSTWSGAAGNPYDPLALGNLYLP